MGAGRDLSMDTAPGGWRYGERWVSAELVSKLPSEGAWPAGRCPRASSAQDRGCDSGHHPVPHPSQVSYMPARGKLETFTPRDVPSALGAKLAVLRLFARRIQQRLREVRARWGRAGLGRCGRPQP